MPHNHPLLHANAQTACRFLLLKRTGQGFEKVTEYVFEIISCLKLFPVRKAVQVVDQQVVGRSKVRAVGDRATISYPYFSSSASVGLRCEVEIVMVA